MGGYENAASSTTIILTPVNDNIDPGGGLDRHPYGNGRKWSRAVVIEGSGAEVIKIDGARGISLSGM